MKKLTIFIALLLSAVTANAQMATNNGVPYLLSQTVDMSGQFSDPTNTYFCADSLVSFDTETGWGVTRWSRQQVHPRQAFNANGYWIVPLENLDFPGPAYDQSPELKFRVEPVNERVLRVRVFTSPIIPKDPTDEVMLVAQPKDGRSKWKVAKTASGVVYKSSEGSLEIQNYPWRLVLRDKNGRELTRTRALSDNDSTQVKTHPSSS